MSFVWPQMLFTLAVLPLIAGFYLWRQRSQRAASQTLSGISAATASGQAWRPHLPPLLFLLGLALMLFALSRPATVVSMPTSPRTVILALDISGSMRATDLQPTRLAAAQAAAVGDLRSSSPPPPSRPLTTRVVGAARRSPSCVARMPGDDNNLINFKQT